MNLLFITTGYPPQADGVGDYTFNLAKEFVKGRHRVSVVCKRMPVECMACEGILVYPLVSRWNLKSVRPVVKLIKESGAEAVLLQYVPHGYSKKGLPFALALLAVAIRRLCNVRLFTFCHELYVGKEKGNPKRNLLSFLMRNITRCIVRQSDNVATSLPVSKKQLQRWVKPGRPVGLIPIPSNVPDCPATAEELEAFRRKFAGDDEVILAFFCSRRNGISLPRLLRLNDQGCKVKILIIGKSAMECPADDRVYKTGILPIDEIGWYLRISDVLILPEAPESGCSFKSGSLMAALRCGLPVLTNRGRLTDESLKDGYNIVFADFTREEAFMPVLADLVKNPEKRCRIGSNAQQTVKHISWEATCAAYTQMMELKNE